VIAGSAIQVKMMFLIQPKLSFLRASIEEQEKELQGPEEDPY
jgi:hypothetical protein